VELLDYSRVDLALWHKGLEHMNIRELLTVMNKNK